MAEPEINVVGLSSSKSKPKTNWKVISAIIGIIVLSLGIIAGILLVRQNQDVREKAACSAQCPASNGNLINCYDTEDTDGEESLCNSAGRIEVCGQNASSARQYCCPSAGSAWTTNLTLCSVATAIPTATATATTTATTTSTSTATSTASASGTASSTKTATASATSTSSVKSTPTSTSQATATAVPIPVTGASWPTIIGGGFGLIMILVSLTLAL